VNIRTRIIAVLLGLITLLGVSITPAHATDPVHYAGAATYFDGNPEFGQLLLGVYYSERLKPGSANTLETRPYIGGDNNIYIWGSPPRGTQRVVYEVQWVRYYDSDGHQWGETTPISGLNCEGTNRIYPDEPFGSSLNLLLFHAASNGGIYEWNHPECWKNSISLSGYALWTNPHSTGNPRIGVYAICRGRDSSRTGQYFCEGRADGISRTMPAV
jgi:hypothetical protein